MLRRLNLTILKYILYGRKPEDSLLLFILYMMFLSIFAMLFINLLNILLILIRLGMFQMISQIQ